MKFIQSLNPFRSGRGLSTFNYSFRHKLGSQSLSFRAWSFDEECLLIPQALTRLNPFRSGRGLSTEQSVATNTGDQCLNPFRSGRGLSTAGCQIFVISQ